MMFLSLESNGQSPQVHILLIHTDSYFTFCTRRERGESQVLPLSLQTQTTINYSFYEKGKVSLTASSGYHLRHSSFIYVDSLGVGKVSNISQLS